MAYPYNDIFKFPDRILLNKRITKTFFLKNFSLLATEKKLLNTTIQGISWIASIKTSNANIPAVVNEEYKFEEIQLIRCSLPESKLDKAGNKCIELIQKYIPYQVVIVVEDEFEFVINVCDKRINRSDTSKRTIEKQFTTQAISKLYKNELSNSFFGVLDFKMLDKTNIETTYKSFINAIIQYQSGRITGVFSQKSNVRTEEDMVNLQIIEILEKEIIFLMRQLKSEKQLNHKVDYNIAIQEKRKEIQNIKKKLSI